MLLYSSSAGTTLQHSTNSGALPARTKTGPAWLALADPAEESSLHVQADLTSVPSIAHVGLREERVQFGPFSLGCFGSEKDIAHENGHVK